MRSGPTRDPVAALELQPERLDELVALQARAPDQRVRGDLGAGLQRDAGRRDGGDAGVRDDLDGALLQRLSRVRAEVRLEHPEDVGPGLDEHDPCLLLRDVRVVPREVAAVELRDRACALDPGRPAAHDDDVERAVLDQARVLVGRLPPPEHVLFQADRVGQRVHGERVLGGTLRPEERDLGAEPEHEEVVGEGRHLRERHLARLEVDRGHRRLVDGDVLLVVVDEVAERVSDGARLEEARRELVQERLEGVVVVPIDQDDVGVRLTQLQRRTEPAEASAEDDDAWAIGAIGHERRRRPEALGEDRPPGAGGHRPNGATPILSLQADAHQLTHGRTPHGDRRMSPLSILAGCAGTEVGRTAERMVAHPFVYEINTWAWLDELSRRAGTMVDLGTVPDSEWEAVASLGFDAVWLMGVWQRSPAGIAVALQNPSLLESFRSALPDFTPDDVVGSPYCVRDYVTDARLGGSEGLAVARQALARHGLGVILDFVPNHVAPDHPWLRDHPEYFVRGDEADLEREQTSFTRVGDVVVANGRDPYFPAWPDVVQLDAFSPGLRAAVTTTLQSLAAQCDGVRCDMAMLVTNDVFERTWGSVPARGPSTTTGRR